MAITTILYDHDGTLVDSEATHYRMWVDVLKPYDVILSEDDYKQFYAGIPTSKNAIEIANRFSLSINPEVLEEAKNSATTLFLSREAFPLMPGVSVSLDLLQKRGLQFGIVTGAGRDGVEVTLRAHELGSYFATVVSGDDVISSKPAPDSYQKAMDHLGVSHSECIAIEDTGNGVLAATAAGITCLAIPNAMSEHHCFDAATEVLGSLNEAAEWIIEHI